MKPKLKVFKFSNVVLTREKHKLTTNICHPIRPTLVLILLLNHLIIP